ncbi:MAG: hypothetical protein JOS17DRAFT_396976 [Linnemannia elongata]|nr:MAG: hypothetical protein JOS17DRAFT_396976 [Linnemannia elongata]
MILLMGVFWEHVDCLFGWFSMLFFPFGYVYVCTACIEQQGPCVMFLLFFVLVINCFASPFPLFTLAVAVVFFGRCQFFVMRPLVGLGKKRGLTVPDGWRRKKGESITVLLSSHTHTHTYTYTLPYPWYPSSSSLSSCRAETTPCFILCNMNLIRY